MVQSRNPLEPVATSVYTMLSLIVAIMVLSVLATIFGSGAVFGIGHEFVCVDSVSGTVRVPQSQSNVVDGVLERVTSSARTVGMCVNSPTFGQRLLETLTQLPTFLALIGALLLAWRLIRSAGRDGIFTERTANRLRGLGWFVLAGELTATLIESVARHWLANTMLRDPVPQLSFLGDWDLPVLALFLGAVLISMARIMRISAAMHKDLEGTV